MFCFMYVCNFVFFNKTLEDYGTFQDLIRLIQVEGNNDEQAKETNGADKTEVDGKIFVLCLRNNYFVALSQCRI